jgi:hypothetical protein
MAVPTTAMVAPLTKANTTAVKIKSFRIEFSFLLGIVTVATSISERVCCGAGCTTGNPFLDLYAPSARASLSARCATPFRLQERSPAAPRGQRNPRSVQQSVRSREPLPHSPPIVTKVDAFRQQPASNCRNSDRYGRHIPTSVIGDLSNNVAGVRS